MGIFFFHMNEIFGTSEIFYKILVIASKLMMDSFLQKLTLCAEFYIEVMYWRIKWGTYPTHKKIYSSFCSLNPVSMIPTE